MLRDRIRRGSALLLAVIGVFTAALLATAAIRMVSGEMLVTENAQVGTEAAYLADQALSQFRVWKGKLNELPVGFTSDFVMSLPKESIENS